MGKRLAVVIALLVTGVMGCQDQEQTENGGQPPPPPTGACCIDEYTCTITTETDCEGEFQGAATNCDVGDCYVGGERFRLTICRCSRYGGTTTAPPPTPPSACSPLPCNPTIAQAPSVTPTNDPTTRSDRVVQGNTCREAVQNAGQPLGLTTNSPTISFTSRTRAQQCPNGKFVTRAKLNQVDLKQTIDISLPSWTPPAGTVQAEIDAFNAGLAALLAHEQSHERLDRESLASTYKPKIEAQANAAACRDSQAEATAAASDLLNRRVNAAFLETWNEVEAAQARLDQPPGCPIRFNCP